MIFSGEGGGGGGGESEPPAQDLEGAERGIFIVFFRGSGPNHVHSN